MVMRATGSITSNLTTSYRDYNCDLYIYMI